MYQITILNTVFRDNGSIIRGSVGHSEYVLGSNIVLGQTPSNFLAKIRVNRAINDELACDFIHVSYKIFCAVSVVVNRMPDFFKVDITPI